MRVSVTLTELACFTETVAKLHDVLCLMGALCNSQDLTDFVIVGTIGNNTCHGYMKYIIVTHFPQN